MFHEWNEQLDTKARWKMLSPKRSERQCSEYWTKLWARQIDLENWRLFLTNKFAQDKTGLDEFPCGYLVVLFGDAGGLALAVVAAVGAAGAVPTTTPHQEAAGPENGIGPLELLAQRHGQVARRAAVQLRFLPKLVEVSASSRGKTKTGRLISVNSCFRNDCTVFRHSIIDC